MNSPVCVRFNDSPPVSVHRKSTHRCLQARDVKKYNACQKWESNEGSKHTQNILSINTCLDYFIIINHAQKLQEFVDLFFPIMPQTCHGEALAFRSLNIKMTTKQHKIHIKLSFYTYQKINNQYNITIQEYTSDND